MQTGLFPLTRSSPQSGREAGASQTPGRPTGRPALQAAYATLRDGLQVPGAGGRNKAPSGPAGSASTAPVPRPSGSRSRRWHSLAPSSQRQMGEGVSATDSVELQPAPGPADVLAGRPLQAASMMGFSHHCSCTAGSCRWRREQEALAFPGGTCEHSELPRLWRETSVSRCHLRSGHASRLDGLSERICTRSELLMGTHM